MPGHVAVEVLRQLIEAVRLGSAAAHASVGRRADWIELSGGSRQVMVMASLRVEGCFWSIGTTAGQRVCLVLVWRWLLHICVCEERERKGLQVERHE